MFGFGRKQKKQLPTQKEVALKLYNESGDLAKLNSCTSPAHQYWYKTNRCSDDVCLSNHLGAILLLFFSAYGCLMIGLVARNGVLGFSLFALINTIPQLVYRITPFVARFFGRRSIYKAIMARLKIGNNHQREVIKILREQTKEKADRSRNIIGASIPKSENDLKELTALRVRVVADSVSDKDEELKRLDGDISKKQAEVEEAKLFLRSIDTNEARELSALSSLEVELDRQDVMGRTNEKGKLNLDGIHERTTRLAIEITGQAPELCSVERLADTYVEYEEAKRRLVNRTKV